MERVEREDDSRQEKPSQVSGNREPRSGAFNEKTTQDEKSTHNIEEEADLEQERKEAMTERD